MTHKPTRTPLALLVLLSALGACAGEASNVLHEERTKRTQPSAQPGPTLKTMGALGYSGSDAGGYSLGLGRSSNRAYGASELACSIPLEPGLQREGYAHVQANDFLDPQDDPLSTFAIDVDTAAYANIRRFIAQGSLPPVDAVRIEELVNYFNYEYATPSGDEPYAVDMEVGAAPWNAQHRLVRIGVQARSIPAGERKASNLVFLLDVSGSMSSANKLPLLKRAFHLLLERLDERDRVAIVVYAGASGVILPSTSCDSKATIHAALEQLAAGGSTNGAAGIELAYQLAAENMIEGGINRVILATDGDFNVGVSDDGGLVRLIEQKAKSGVFLSVLGFGMGNYQDAKLELLADKGNGNYAYVDSLLEARKVLVEEMGATLETVAKDVKLQVEFNPAHVAQYRLLGYENRLLAARDFNDDTKDAGEMGAGHSVTALYEIVPVGGAEATSSVDPLRYQSDRSSETRHADELLQVKLRYKRPDEDHSRLATFTLADEGKSFYECSADTRFAASVAAFGMLLRGSEHKGKATLADVQGWATESLADDRGGYRQQFLQLVAAASALGDERLAQR